MFFRLAFDPLDKIFFDFSKRKSTKLVLIKKKIIYRKWLEILTINN